MDVHQVLTVPALALFLTVPQFLYGEFLFLLCLAHSAKNRGEATMAQRKVQLPGTLASPTVLAAVEAKCSRAHDYENLQKRDILPSATS